MFCFQCRNRGTMMVPVLAWVHALLVEALPLSVCKKKINKYWIYLRMMTYYLLIPLQGLTILSVLLLVLHALICSGSQGQNLADPHAGEVTASCWKAFCPGQTLVAPVVGSLRSCIRIFSQQFKGLFYFVLTQVNRPHVESCCLQTGFIKRKLRGPGKLWGLTFKLVKMFQLCHKTELVSVVVTVVSHCNLCFPSEIIKCPLSFVCHMPDAHTWSDVAMDALTQHRTTHPLWGEDLRAACSWSYLQLHVARTA